MPSRRARRGTTAGMARPNARLENMFKKTLFRAFLALLALGAFTLQSRADVITTNVDPWMIAAPGNPQTGPPLLDILRFSVDGGRIFTNQTTGAPFAVGSTVKTVGVFT